MREVVLHRVLRKTSPAKGSPLNLGMRTAHSVVINGAVHALINGTPRDQSVINNDEEGEIGKKAEPASYSSRASGRVLRFGRWPFTFPRKRRLADSTLTRAG